MLYQQKRDRLDRWKIGQRIRTRILQQYDTVPEFAEKAGMTPSTIYKIIHGDVRPSSQTLVALSKHLDCSTDFLLGNLEPEESPQAGLETTLINIYQHHSAWTRGQKMFAVCTILDSLSPEEEAKLRRKLGLE